ncbi:predicted protein [Uncinocarpus reesii 1704]|uniref:Uncharacterized protein n=1 Tax=Uncinocarpus reesii (strain UAMH 1704) TaxID=336963 RepID=C4JML6_UNCRE|nr:uncharacterized protein UREG_04074 [Uncinocarpus reesii 1704]EEP79228.1 predicted protein [Uncinocarpus reesii 1704]
MATPAQPAETSSPQSNGPSIDPYQQLHSYPFTTDPEFKLGLAVILRQPGTPATDEQVNRADDLVLRAKCFYFSRVWLQAHSLDPEFEPAPDQLASETPPSQAPIPSSASDEQPQATSTTTQEQPAYPASFAHIVELITTGQPIPGIQQIPDTILTGQDAPSTAERRRKPWEKLEETQAQENQSGAGTTAR